MKEILKDVYLNTKAIVFHIRSLHFAYETLGFESSFVLQLSKQNITVNMKAFVELSSEDMKFQRSNRIKILTSKK